MEELIEGDEYQKKNTMEIDGYQNLKESQKKLLKDLAHEFLEAGEKECDKSWKHVRTRRREKYVL